MEAHARPMLTTERGLPVELVTGLGRATRLHVLLGEDALFDAPLASDCDVAPDAALRASVESLCARAGTRVTVASRRQRPLVERCFRATGAACYADHGAWRTGRPWRWERRVAVDPAWRARAGAALAGIGRAQRRSLFEEGEDSVALVCYALHEGARAQWIDEVRGRVEALARAEGATAEYLPDRVILRPRAHTPRNAVLDAIAGRLPGEELLVIDRERAEDGMLLAVIGHGVAVKVGGPRSRIPWSLDDASALRRLLEALASS